MVQARGVLKKKMVMSASNLVILDSQVDIVIVGGRNKVKIEESAGRVAFIGDDNQIEIRKSWLACRVEGNQNQFNISQSEFQLISHRG
jgi:hypothetical protein